MTGRLLIPSSIQACRHFYHHPAGGEDTCTLEGRARGHDGVEPISYPVPMRPFQHAARKRTGLFCRSLTKGLVSARILSSPSRREIQLLWGRRQTSAHAFPFQRPLLVNVSSAFRRRAPSTCRKSLGSRTPRARLAGRRRIGAVACTWSQSPCEWWGALPNE